MQVVFKNIGRLLTLKKARAKQGRHVQSSDLSVIKDAVIYSEKGKIRWIGSKKQWLAGKQKQIANRVNLKTVKIFDLDGRDVMPGFVECHTHSVFAGSRQNEFELRNQGATYQDVAQAGGGILSTVKATRKASEADLLMLAQQRSDIFLKQGVTTLEIKSGYGLNLANELKMLRVANQLKTQRVVSTFLGPHACPTESASAKAYVEDLIKKYLPAIKKSRLSCRADIFIEKGYFDLPLAKMYMDACVQLGFNLGVHTDQMNAIGGARAAIERGALSVDHCVQLPKKEIETLAPSNTTFVLLPIADLYLKMNYPQARSLIDAGARVAVSTDFNPGSSPSQDLSLVGMLSRLQMGMSLAEVIVAYTVGASYALGLQNQVGSIEPGMECDMVALDDGWENLFYRVGHHPVHSVFRGSRRVFLKKGL